MSSYNSGFAYPCSYRNANKKIIIKPVSLKMNISENSEKSKHKIEKIDKIKNISIPILTHRQYNHNKKFDENNIHSLTSNTYISKTIDCSRKKAHSYKFFVEKPKKNGNKYICRKCKAKLNDILNNRINYLHINKTIPRNLDRKNLDNYSQKTRNSSNFFYKTINYSSNSSTKIHENSFQNKSLKNYLLKKNNYKPKTFKPMKYSVIPFNLKSKATKKLLSVDLLRNIIHNVNEYDFNNTEKITTSETISLKTNIKTMPASERFEKKKEFIDVKIPKKTRSVEKNGKISDIIEQTVIKTLVNNELINLTKEELEKIKNKKIKLIKENISKFTTTTKTIIPQNIKNIKNNNDNTISNIRPKIGLYQVYSPKCENKKKSNIIEANSPIIRRKVIDKKYKIVAKIRKKSEEENSQNENNNNVKSVQEKKSEKMNKKVNKIDKQLNINEEKNINKENNKNLEKDGKNEKNKCINSEKIQKNNPNLNSVINKEIKKDELKTKEKLIDISKKSNNNELSNYFNNSKSNQKMNKEENKKLQINKVEKDKNDEYFATNSEIQKN